MLVAILFALSAVLSQILHSTSSLTGLLLNYLTLPSSKCVLKAPETSGGPCGFGISDWPFHLFKGRAFCSSFFFFSNLLCMARPVLPVSLPLKLNLRKHNSSDMDTSTTSTEKIHSIHCRMRFVGKFRKNCFVCVQMCTNMISLIPLRSGLRPLKIFLLFDF